MGADSLAGPHVTQAGPMTAYCGGGGSACQVGGCCARVCGGACWVFPLRQGLCALLACKGGGARGLPCGCWGGLVGVAGGWA